MKKYLQQAFAFASAMIVSSAACHLSAQTLEWRLVNPVYSSADPDGQASPATGSVSFTMQIHTQSAASVLITGLSTGWAYQSSKTMIPTGAAGPGCPTSNYPSGAAVANVTMSAAFTAAGLTYQTVNQCNTLTTPVTTGGQSFDKRAVGTITGGTSAINLTTTWMDVFTVTLWTLGTTAPQGGYAVINSGEGGLPAPFGNYSASDADANQFAVNSLTYTTPLSIGAALPITLSKFNAACTGVGSLLSWETLTEINNDHFEIEKSTGGITAWNVITTVKGAGNSTTARQYQFTDATASGTSYYRLKQVDTDGRFTYSSVEKTDCQNKAAQFAVYPVPAKDILNVVLSAERNSTAIIKLTDIAGRVYKLQKTDVLKGSNKIILNVANLLTGQYILRIEKDNEVQTRVVMIK